VTGSGPTAYDRRMPDRARLVVVALTAIAVSAVAGCGSGGQPVTGVAGMHGIGAAAAPVVPPAAIARAREVATPNADGTPFVVVRTQVLTPAEAAAAGRRSGSEDIAVATNGAPAYLITFRGAFVGRAVSHPAGTQAPRGRYFSVGINGADLSVSGLSITGDEPAPWHRS
jgi:hypothetical protein